MVLVRFVFIFNFKKTSGIIWRMPRVRTLKTAVFHRYLLKCNIANDPKLSIARTHHEPVNSKILPSTRKFLTTMSIPENYFATFRPFLLKINCTRINKISLNLVQSLTTSEPFVFGTRRYSAVECKRYDFFSFNFLFYFIDRFFFFFNPKWGPKVLCGRLIY